MTGRPGSRASRCAIAALALAIALLPACSEPEREPSAAAQSAPREPASVKGTLRIGAFGASGAAKGLPHRSRFRNGAVYDGMEDVDLRGFLDGRFIYGWNQPGQIHVRLGRRPTRPRFGETELYRNLHRWDGVVLPARAEVERASLTLHVEKGAKRDLTLLLYALHPPFEPGQGGTRNDNTSPPAPGEVWWGAAAQGEQSWGLPGAGFASDTHPDADTPVEALAEASLAADAERVRFSSPALAAYVEERATRGESLQLLVKLSDLQEDTPGTQIFLFSANVGVPHAPARRPSLEIDWSAPRDQLAIEHALHLEAGRSLSLGSHEVRGARVLAASFVAESGFEAPTLLVRGGRDGAEPDDWRPIEAPIENPGWDWLELRVVAGQNLVSLGDAFESGFRDTWVRTAPPDAQRVDVWFRSPSGTLHETTAEYEGDYRWAIRFVPDELGRWSFGFRQAFLKRPFESATGSFDVVALDREVARRGLEALLERIEREHPNASDRDEIPLRPHFWKLERAALALETPEHFASEEGRELFALLTRVREAISGRRVPRELEPAPMDREF